MLHPQQGWNATSEQGLAFCKLIIQVNDSFD